MLLLVDSVSLPIKNNVAVGVCCTGGTYAQELTDRLIEDETLYDFQTYENREELEQAVLSGQLECGFIVGPELDEQVKEGKIREAIVCVTTPMSVKGAVIRETVYAEFLEIYSAEILQQAEADIFGVEDEQRTKELLEYNRFNQEGTSTFQMEVHEIDTATVTGQEQVDNEQTYPIRGMVGLLIFLIMFLAHGRKFDEGGLAVEKALTKSERFVFGCLNHAAAGTFACVVGMVLILVLTDTNAVVKELLALILLVVISSVWIMIVGSFMKAHTSFVACTLTIVIANLLLCPIFINLEAFVPALTYVKMIFPLGIYLQL